MTGYFNWSKGRRWRARYGERFGMGCIEKPLIRGESLADSPSMILRRLIISVLLGLMVTTASLAQEGPGRGEHKEPATELGKWMDKMSSAFRQVRRQVAVPEQNAATRELVATMINAAEKARALTPEKIDEVAADDHAKFLNGFHEQMDKLLVALRQLDAVLAAGDNAAAEAIVRDLRGIQRDGHKAYKKDRG